MKDFRTEWKRLATEKKATAKDHAAFAILRAVNAKTNADKFEIACALLAKAFTPMSRNNPSLWNGVPSRFNGLEAAISWLNNEYKYAQKVMGLKTEDVFETVDEEVRYAEIIGKLAKTDFDGFLDRHYVYIFVDTENVTPEQQMVQAAHVAMVIGQNMDAKFNAHHIFYQIVKADENYNFIMERFPKLRWEVFVEPDLGNRVVAFGTHPIPYHARGELLKYELLAFAAVPALV